jgi:alkanesulfonate monooxygenase SsuD/methylene tetrahydromethanopterin reductase-like flavin-dependent oxidoreductase (luciferase family)
MREPVTRQPETGVLVPPHIPAGDLAGFAQQAEQLGFAGAWVAEDCAAPPDHQLPSQPPSPTAGSIASRSSARRNEPGIS